MSKAFCIVIKKKLNSWSIIPCSNYHGTDYTYVIAFGYYPQINLVKEHVRTKFKEKRIHTHVFEDTIGFHIFGDNPDLLCICIRCLVKAFISTCYARSAYLPYLIVHRGYEYILETKWERSDWHVSYTIYKDLTAIPVKPEEKKSCTIL